MVVELTYRVLGPVEIWRGETKVPVEGRHRRTVLAALLLARGRLVTDSRLIAAVWGEQPPPTVSAQLFTYVSRLRGLIGGDGAIVRQDGGYSLLVDPEQLDLARFEELTSRGRAALATGASGAASGWLRDALALWRGPALSGVSEQLARGERPGLEEARLTALEGAVDAELALGQHVELIPELTSLVAEYPLRERMRGQLMMALYRAGRQAEALEAYRSGRQTLVEELGLEPGVQLRQLEHAILNGDPALQPVSRDGGGVAGPEVIRLGNAGRAPVSNAADGLYGRDRELAELAGLLHDARLVTLVGPPGVGKTRLAAELAAVVSDRYPDGLCLAELDSVTDPALVGEAVAGALGAGGHGNAAAVDRLARWLSGRRSLLILDNCEHVARACAQLINELIRRCPDQTVLATSRQALGHQRETVRHIGPLGLPERDDADAVRAAPAGQLFLARAAEAGSEFALSGQNAPAVGRLCRTLGGLPLALELAAARLRALTVEEIADRIDLQLELLARPSCAEARHESLRTAFDWSYELLTEAEQRAFARLSVFAGGCFIDAAEAVIGDERVPPDQVLEVLCRLVDRSLVDTDRQPQGTRYRLLGSLRTYAARHLVTQGDSAAVQHRHVLFFCELAEEAERECRGRRGPLLIARLHGEFANLRAAALAAHEHGLDEARLRLVAALRVFTGYPGEVEVLTWTRSALSGAPATASPRLVAAAGITAGALAMCIVPSEACAFLTAAADMAQACGERALGFAARLELAKALWLDGDFPNARHHAHWVIEAARQGGEDFWLAQALLLAGRMSGHDGDLPRARELIDAAQNLFASRMDDAGVRETMTVLGQVACVHGLLDEAADLIARAEQIQAPIPVTESLPTWIALGWIACRQGHADSAAVYLTRVLTEGVDLLELPGLQTWITIPALHLGAGIALAQQDARAAAIMLAACDSLGKAVVLPPTAQALQESLRVALSAKFDAASLDSARSLGESMTVEKAVSYALANCAGLIAQ